jgi:hypothetical protein
MNLKHWISVQKARVVWLYFMMKAVDLLDTVSCLMTCRLSCQNDLRNIMICVNTRYKKVKESHNRPGVAQRVPEGLVTKIS